MKDYSSWASNRIDEIFNQPKEDVLKLLNDIDFFRDKTGEIPIYDELENI